MKFYPVKLTAITIISIVSSLSNADYVDTDIIDATNMSRVGFSLQGDGITLSGNTYQFPKSGHYCSVKTVNGDFKAGEILTLRLNKQDALDNGLSLRLLTWGAGQYKGYGGHSGHAELSRELLFDASRISVGFCRYNNRDFDSFELSEFTVQLTQEVVAEAQKTTPDPSAEILPVYPSCRE